jgi:protein-tyrosine phosphatase
MRGAAPDRFLKAQIRGSIFGGLRKTVDSILWVVREPQAALAIVMRPEGGDWLEDELARMKRGGIDTMVSMLEPWEAATLGLASEGEMAEQAGMQFLSFPIPDRHTPPEMQAFRAFATELARRLRAGERIGVHCRGSIGRSTVAAASALMHLGWKAKDALAAIESARCCPVPDTPEQRTWILAYEPQP